MNSPHPTCTVKCVHIWSACSNLCRVLPANVAANCLGWSLSALKAAVHAAIKALELLHGHGLVHTDIRAADILWYNDKPFVINLEQVHRAGYNVCCLLHPYLLVKILESSTVQ